MQHALRTLSDWGWAARRLSIRSAAGSAAAARHPQDRVGHVEPAATFFPHRPEAHGTILPVGAVLPTVTARPEVVRMGSEADAVAGGPDESPLSEMLAQEPSRLTRRFLYALL